MSRSGAHLPFPELPKDVHDQPTIIDLGEMQVIDVFGRNAFRRCNVPEHIENRAIVSSLWLRHVTTTPLLRECDHPGSIHGASQTPRSLFIAPQCALHEIWMQTARHPCHVRIIPPFNVIQNGLPDRVVFILIRRHARRSRSTHRIASPEHRSSPGIPITLAVGGPATRARARMSRAGHAVHPDSNPDGGAPQHAGLEQRILTGPALRSIRVSAIFAPHHRCERCAVAPLPQRHCSSGGFRDRHRERVIPP